MCCVCVCGFFLILLFLPFLANVTQSLARCTIIHRSKQGNMFCVCALFYYLFCCLCAINAFLLFTYVQIFHSMLLSYSIFLTPGTCTLFFFARMSSGLLAIDKSNMFSLTLVSLCIHHMFKWKKKYVCASVKTFVQILKNTHKKVAHALGNRMTVRTVK